MTYTPTRGLSGLSDLHRVKARDLAVEAAYLGLRRASSLHYTQTAERWQGIDHHLKAWRGQCPTQADCSAFATWCLWNGLDHFGVRDVVNGADWKAGYTGTMHTHGVRVTGAVQRADLVLYGDPYGRTGHVAVAVGRNRAGRLLVISHGSEGGPYLLQAAYRPIAEIRRFI